MLYPDERLGKKVFRDAIDGAAAKVGLETAHAWEDPSAQRVRGQRVNAALRSTEAGRALRVTVATEADPTDHIAPHSTAKILEIPLDPEASLPCAAVVVGVAVGPKLAVGPLVRLSVASIATQRLARARDASLASGAGRATAADHPWGQPDGACVHVGLAAETDFTQIAPLDVSRAIDHGPGVAPGPRA